MNKSTIKDYTFTFYSSKQPEIIFDTLLDVRSWWSGLFSESITGNTNELNEEFTFKAGDGVHYSKQKLVELIPNQKMVWLVTDSKLSFIEDTGEWTGSKICFEIFKQDNKTKICFTHQGLVPKIECYAACTGAWTQYLGNLAEELK